jgi:calcineurin-like phosphoesterase family protein
MNIWITSDLHFDHANIITYSNRPYHYVKEMNDELISNWNFLVEPEDTVYFLGDFSMGKHTLERDRDLFLSLNGTKYMVLGNHDFNFKSTNESGGIAKIKREHAVAYWRSVGFIQVYDYPIVLEKYWILSHAPIDGINKTQIFANIHGHTHTVSLSGGNYFNACVENTAYSPIKFEEIKEKFSGT